MNNSLKFRTYKITDIDKILDIYNFYINNGLGNFEEIPLSFKKFLNLSETILNNNLPFIVCEIEEKIVGFTYLNKFRNKTGYRFSFENSVYVDNSFTGKGIGSNLLKELIKMSKKNSKIKNIIAVIGGKKPIASIKIHEKNGFKIIGTLKKIAFKKNQWLDSIYMQKIINEKN